jgi:hypothetical protein
MTSVEALRTHRGNDVYSNKELVGWLIWAEENGCLIRLVDETGITGLMIVRPGNPECLDLEAINPHGPVLHIDYCYAKDRDALRAMTRSAMSRFGIRWSVAVKRHGGTMKYHDYKKVVKAILGDKL